MNKFEEYLKFAFVDNTIKIFACKFAGLEYEYYKGRRDAFKSAYKKAFEKELKLKIKWDDLATRVEILSNFKANSEFNEQIMKVLQDSINIEIEE